MIIKRRAQRQSAMPLIAGHGRGVMCVPVSPIVDGRQTVGVPRLNGAGLVGVQRLPALLAVAGGLSSLSALGACAPILSLAGSSGPAVFLATQLDRLKLLGDGVSYVQTGKTLSDRALSSVAGGDCHTFNVVTGRPICSTANQAAPVEER
jgi:hypothetical protein